MRIRRAMTLIELLVAVGILSILAALAIPSALDAQTRSKVARSRADLAAIRTALEAYATDHGTYPLNRGGVGLAGALVRLTRPVRYMEALPRDPFTDRAGYFYSAAGRIREAESRDVGAYVAAGTGPDRGIESSLVNVLHYDPTNGTVSAGDIAVTHAAR